MNGILLLNKPQNMTSHDCVNKIRKLLHTKKVGHLGTLDPNVTGVLPLCINDATKIIQFLESGQKEYVATVSIGTSTATEDHDGEVIEDDTSFKIITREELLAVLEGFLGEQLQTPPMISAIKINGKKLYEYARKGIEIERPKRTITIHDIELLSNEETFSGHEISFKIRVLCSKGTYIRTLAVDIGKELGFPSHMKNLVRTQSGQFTLQDCFTLEQVEQNDFKLISPYDALKIYPMVVADEDLYFKINNGQRMNNSFEFDDYLVFCDEQKNILGIYEKETNDTIKPVRVFRRED